jgi:hypothetical protein
MFSDIGRFVGRYFQVLGLLSIASIFIDLIFFDYFHLDLSFIFMFWGAAHLIQHNPTARKWTIGICASILVGLTIMLSYAWLAGTQNMTITLGFRIEHPHFWQVALVGGTLAVLMAPPLFLLLTPQARQEFSTSRMTEGGPTG